jgi:hypothetical protein
MIAFHLVWGDLLVGVPWNLNYGLFCRCALRCAFEFHAPKSGAEVAEA